MNRRTLVLTAAAGVGLSLGMLLEPDPTRWSTEAGIMSNAEARIGRPLTPLSVAGVARRTTRRVLRRTTIYVATLPPGCVPVRINGHQYYECGLNYYESYGGQYVLVEQQ